MMRTRTWGKKKNWDSYRACFDSSRSLVVKLERTRGNPVALEEPPAWHLFFRWTWYLKVSPCVGLGNGARCRPAFSRAWHAPVTARGTGGSAARRGRPSPVSVYRKRQPRSRPVSLFLSRFSPCPAAVCRSERRDRKSATVTALIIKEATSPTTYSGLDFVLAE